jgi:hypothetical protein
MSEKETNLVEAAEAVETTTQESAADTSATEESKDSSAFDPAAFASDQLMEEFQGKYNEEAADKADEIQSSEEAEEPIEREGNFAWDEIEVDQPEQEEEVEEEIEEDWDSEPEAVVEAQPDQEMENEEEAGELDWSAFANELGLEGATKEDIIQALNSPFIEQPKNETIDKLNEYLSYSDRELISAEMKVDGMEDFEIEEALDKMEDSGVMKREAYRIRRQLNNAIEQEKTKFFKEKQQEELSNKEKVARNKKELQGTLKEMKSFMGGAVTKTQSKEAYNYITSGKMAEDIWKSHDNASEVAMFMLFKDKFAKILRSQGLEDGKAKILNEITAPSLSSKSRPRTKVKGSGFDPSAFMRE